MGGTVVWQTAEEVEGEGPVEHTAVITAHGGTTLTLDGATGLVVGSHVVAYTVPLWTRAVLTDVDGLTLTAPELAGAPLTLAGGSLTWTNADGLVERRSIMTHSGDGITVLYGSADLQEGLEVTAIPGCPRTWGACEERGNTVHYGGALYKPGKNPSEDSMSWG
ncbi:phage BR0599 family protein [Lysobacter enzymogenes]|uniref:phage BR0599 family protein n=1 Tax=Lysobacter enzymogenes TaxID=69 RepID=UPI00226539BF|nr:phage BR0599 family protein [Lysobacter enzymogenes]UZW62767.1 phage BR0599 family protein [Lysobacter enzymogenes]